MKTAILRNHDYLIKKMYSFAEADISQDKHEITWTPEQALSFKEWMTDYLKTHKGIRRMMMTKPEKGKVEEFVVNWIVLFGFGLE
jgi:hypothetical protein